MEIMEKYVINETIRKVDGTRMWAVNKIVGEMMGFPIVEEVFRGSLEECQKYVEEHK